MEPDIAVVVYCVAYSNSWTMLLEEDIIYDNGNMEHK
jgi:hypothetical protein